MSSFTFGVVNSVCVVPQITYEVSALAHLAEEALGVVAKSITSPPPPAYVVRGFADICFLIFHAVYTLLTANQYLPRL